MSYTPPTPLSTTPATVTFGGSEQWSAAIDCTNLLSGYTAGTVPTNAATVLFDINANRTVTLGANPTIIGSLVFQQIPKNVVISGHTYRLILTVTPSGTTDVLEAILQVFVPPNS